MPSSSQSCRSLPKSALPGHLQKLKTTTYHDPLLPRSNPTHALRTLSWSPLGSLIATGSSTSVLRVWNPERTGVKHSTELRVGGNGNGNGDGSVLGGGGPGGIDKVAWRPDREAELCSVGADGICRFWDVRAKRCVGEVAVCGDAFTVGWRGASGELLVGRKDDTLVHINRNMLQVDAMHRQNVQTNQTCFSWGGETLFMTTGEGTVKIVDFPSMNLLHTLSAHTSSCTTLSLSPTGTHLATGGSDALICLWDTTHFVCQHSLTSLVGPVRSVSFSHDGSYVVGGSDEGSSIDILHMATGEVVHRIETAWAQPVVEWSPVRYAIAFSGDPAGLRVIGAVGCS